MGYGAQGVAASHGHCLCLCFLLFGASLLTFGVGFVVFGFVVVGLVVVGFVV